MITRRAALTAALLAPFVGCTREQENGTLTVGLTYIPNVQFSPFYVAEAEGLFADSGIDVTLRHHGAQEDLFSAVQSGQEDVVFASSDEAVVAAAGGASLVTFATAFQTYPGVILAKQASSLPDLAGKQVGLPGRYGSNWYALQAALLQAGMTEADIDIVEIGYTQVTSLATDKVDAVVGFRNNDEVQLTGMGVEFQRIDVQDPSAPVLVGPGLISVAGETDEAHLKAVKEAVEEAERRIMAEPDLALDATQKHVPTLSEPEQRANAEAVLAATMELWLRDGEPSLAPDTAGIERMGEFLKEIGVTDAIPDQPVLALE